MRSLRSSRHGWVRPGWLLALLALFVFALATAPSGFAFDHPRDDGHSRRSDPDDPPDPDEPPDEPEDECDATACPVYMREGALVLGSTDLTVDGLIPIVVRRTYNSQDSRHGLVGFGWTHGFELRVIPITDGTEEGAIVRWPNGQRHRFARQPDGTYAPPLGSDLELTATASGFRLDNCRPDEDLDCEFDADGNLTRVSDDNGNTADFFYGAAGQCVEHVANSLGDTVLSRDANGRIASITDPAGRTVGYGYDGLGNLTSVTDPRGEITTYVYDGLNRLIEVRNPLSQVTTAVTYNSQGKVQRLIDGTGDFSFTYGSSSTTKTDNFSGGQWIYAFDSQGVIVSVTDSLGNSESRSYDSEYNLVSRTDAEGNTTQWTYDSSGNILSETDPLGNVTLFTYTASDDVATITSPLGRVTSFDYDGSGNVLQKIEALGDPLERVTSYTHDGDGNVLSVTDPGGNTTTYAYDAQGRPSQETDPLGETSTLQYDANGNITSKTDKNGSTTSFSYDQLGNATSVDHPDGTSEALEYDAAGWLARKTDQLGNATSFEYDAFGRMTRQTDPLGNETLFTYDPSGRTLTRTDAGGNVESWTYDAAGRIASNTDPLAATTAFTYTPADQIATETGPRGGVTTYTYDDDDRLVRTVDPVGGETLNEYDAEGRRTAVTDDNGNRMELTYDLLGRLSLQTNPDGSTVQFQYDSLDNQIAKVDERGQTFTSEYNARDERTRLVDPGGLAITYGYDANGNPTTRTLPDGTVQTVTYDSLNRRASVQDDLGTKATYQYDSAGRLAAANNGLQPVSSYVRDAVAKPLTIADGAGRQTQLEYDALDQLRRMTDPTGRVTELDYDSAGRKTSETIYPTGTGGAAVTTVYAYDSAGNVVQITDGNGNVTSYEYDLANRLTRVVYPDANSDDFAYDGAGNLIAETNGDGQQAIFSHDYRGNMIRADFPDGSWKQFTYTPDGRVLVGENPHSRIDFAYDASRRVTSIAQTGTEPFSYLFTTSYSYDDANNKVTITYPSGKTVETLYSPRDELLEIIENGTQTAAFDYDPGVLRKLARINYGNGTSAQYTWDGAGAPLSARHLDNFGAVFSGHAYNLDASGAVVGTVNDLPFDSLRPDTFSEDATLDQAVRLTGFEEGEAVSGGGVVPVNSSSWALDGPGNWTAAVIDGQAFSNTANAANQYDVFQNATNVHDANGNLTSDDDRDYVYDFENHLTQVTGPSGVSDYFYDAFGRRIAKRVGTSSSAYALGLASQVLEEHEDGALARSFVWSGPRGRLATIQDAAGPRYYAHRDAIGSVMALTDGSGDVAERYAYDAYGTPVILDGAGNQLTASQVGNPYLFVDYRWDSEIAAYSVGARVFSPERGRFLQRDPVEAAARDHLYAYAGNDPLNYYDPLGLDRANDWALDFGFEAAAYEGLGASVSLSGNPDFKDCCDENDQKIVWGDKKVTVEAKIEAGIGIGAKIKAFGFKFGGVLKGPQVSGAMAYSFSTSKCGGPFDTASLCRTLSFDPTISGSLGLGPFSIGFSVGTHWFLEGCVTLTSANGRSITFKLEGCASAEATISGTIWIFKYTDGWKGEKICKDFVNRSFSF